MENFAMLNRGSTDSARHVPPLQHSAPPQRGVPEEDDDPSEFDDFTDETDDGDTIIEEETTSVARRTGAAPPVPAAGMAHSASSGLAPPAAQPSSPPLGSASVAPNAAASVFTSDTESARSHQPHAPFGGVERTGTEPQQRGGLFSRLRRKKEPELEPSIPPTSGDGTGRLRRYSSNQSGNAPAMNRAVSSGDLRGARPFGGVRQNNNDVLPPLPTQTTTAAPNAPSSAPVARTAPAARTRATPAAREQPEATGMGRAGAGASRPGVRRILVKGVSPRTMQALVFYLYTNQVHFVAFPHLPADGKVNDLHEEALEQMGDGSKQNPALWPPAFSSKAAYCLGQQLGLIDLTVRAFDHLTLNLSPRTVLSDLLSPFGDRFSDVQAAYLEFITHNWEHVKTQPDFVPTIENLAHGQYPKSSAALFQLFSKLSMRNY